MPHDGAYKAMFSNPDMVRSLLLDFVPEEFVNDFDFSTLANCSSEYVSDGFEVRQGDLVWRVRFRDTTCYVYLLMEFQSSVDHFMAVRILAYTVLLWQALIKRGEVKTDSPLPLAFPLVIYNGKQPWKAPTDVRDLLPPLPEGLSVYQPSQRFFLLDACQIDHEIINKAKGIAANIFRMERSKSEDDFAYALQETINQLSDQKHSELLRTIFEWLGRTLLRDTPVAAKISIVDSKEAEAMLAETIAQIREEYGRKCLFQGIEKGREEGLLDGQRRTLVQLLTDRFEEIPASWPERFSEITNSVSLAELIRAVYKVESMSEFEKKLNAVHKLT